MVIGGPFFNLGISAVVVLMGALASLYLKRIEYPEQEKIAEIERTRRDRVAITIAEIIISVYEYVMEDSDDGEQEISLEILGQREEVIQLVQEAFREGDEEMMHPDEGGIPDEHLNTLGGDLHFMAEPQTLFQSCKVSHRNSFYAYTCAFIIGIGTGLVFLLIGANPSLQSQLITNPELQLIDWAIAAFLILSIVSLGIGIWYSYEWEEYHRKLDAMLDESVFILEPNSVPYEIPVRYGIYAYSLMTMSIAIAAILSFAN